MPTPLKKEAQTIIARECGQRADFGCPEISRARDGYVWQILLMGDRVVTQNGSGTPDGHWDVSLAKATEVADILESWNTGYWIARWEAAQ